jgi:hypothetical protein
LYTLAKHMQFDSVHPIPVIHPFLHSVDGSKFTAINVGRYQYINTVGSEQKQDRRLVQTKVD